MIIFINHVLFLLTHTENSEIISLNIFWNSIEVIIIKKCYLIEAFNIAQKQNQCTNSWSSSVSIPDNYLPSYQSNRLSSWEYDSLFSLEEEPIARYIESRESSFDLKDLWIFSKTSVSQLNFKLHQNYQYQNKQNEQSASLIEHNKVNDEERSVNEVNSNARELIEIMQDKVLNDPLINELIKGKIYANLLETLLIKKNSRIAFNLRDWTQVFLLERKYYKLLRNKATNETRRMRKKALTKNDRNEYEMLVNLISKLEESIK